jgi:hypothetical protein
VLSPPGVDLRVASGRAPAGSSPAARGLRQDPRQDPPRVEGVPDVCAVVRLRGTGDPEGR